MTTALWWIRRDLRLSDNEALASALEHADRVVPLFVLDRHPLVSPDASEKRFAFLLGGLYRLDDELRARGSRLIVRRGHPEEALAALVRETGAAAIFAEAEGSPQATQRDAELAKTLPLHLTSGLTVHPPEAVRPSGGEPQNLFPAFRRAWNALPLPDVRDVLRAPEALAPPPPVDSLPLPGEPVLPPSVPFPPGEAEAQLRLEAFIDWDGNEHSRYPAPIYRYDDQRRRLDLDGTSQLSPYLRFGMLSARQAVVSALSAIDAAPNSEARHSATLWLDALIWREFAASLLYQLPQGLRAEWHNRSGRNDSAAFQAWTAGRTGVPLVDAAMRQLVQTGWLHDRARMIAASFLVGELRVEWRWGERFFMQHLVDGDLAANRAGWHRAVGSSTGPAPYLGTLDSAYEARTYDPEGAYVRRWVPELDRIPAAYIHQPWSMPLDVQVESGFVIGQDYPAPMVDLDRARGRTSAFLSSAGQAIEH
jgi:deoxyribodipyrimidine photo-lyase